METKANPNEKILEKIKKLVNKRDSLLELGSLAEAETFAAKIQDLLAQHNLDMGQIDFTEAGSILDEWLRIKLPSIGGQTAFDLMYPIAKYNWCHCYKSVRLGHDKMLIVGTPDNVDVCKYIFEMVSKALIAVCKKEYNTFISNLDFYAKRDAIKYDTYARAFFRGAGKGLAIKLETERKMFERRNEAAYGLIVTNSAALKSFTAEKYKAQAGTSSRAVNKETDAFTKGKEAGVSVEINKAVTGETKPIERPKLNG